MQPLRQRKAPMAVLPRLRQGVCWGVAREAIGSEARGGRV